MIARKLRIGLLALSSIRDDPRVRRQGDAFTEAGWNVVAFGAAGGASAAPAWTIVDITEPAPGEVHRRSGWLQRNHLVRRIALLAQALLSRVFPALVERIYWSLDRDFDAMYAAARAHRVDIWLANDWATLPIARRLAAEQGALYAYDTHELATEEYAQNWRWRLVRRPLIHRIEARGIAGAVLVSCVSQGIATRLEAIYGLKSRPFVLRNIPAFEPAPERPLGKTIRVLYHGVVASGRGLEACIASVAMWRPEFDLTIRGTVTPDYRTHLLGLIEKAGVQSRVRLAPAVPATDLVAAATEFDVGLFALPGHSLHNLHALPNKFFEYMAAGLALCVSDLPEMALLVKQHDLGEIIGEVTPEAIAEAINRLDPTSVSRFKASARAASKVLNAKTEGAAFLEAFRGAVAAAISARPPA